MDKNSSRDCPTTEIRNLSKNYNYSGFFGNDQINERGHVDLSLDLELLNYPDQYSLYFYVYDFLDDGLRRYKIQTVLPSAIPKIGL
jgi:hypothetical protein